MRLTIERMRTLVLVAGALLVVALATFLIIDKLKNPFSRRDLPQRLGVDIQQEASGFSYTQSHGGHTLFRIHASRVVQLKKGNALLHDVRIDLYGADGSRVDRIEGNEFEYDQQAGKARATGPVEITLTRPDVAPAIAPNATASQAMGDKPKNGRLAAAAQTAARSEIHVETSGLVFDQNSGVANTSQLVEFTLAQGSGSAMGATYESQQGRLVLDRAVQLHLQRGADMVQLRASHAEFERGDQVCRMNAAIANYRGSEAQAEEVMILFRDDGSAARLDAQKGFTLITAMGSRMTAPTGMLEFDAHNQPQSGRLEGGVTIDSDRGWRKVHGTAPTMDLEFAADGVLRHAHLERDVKLVSDEQNGTGSRLMRTHQSWASPMADLEFRNAGEGRVELATMHGSGGVVVTDESQRGSSITGPSRMTADEVTGTFGEDSTLTAMTGTGHASIEETTPAGVRQTTSGDRLVAHFAAGQAAGAKAAEKSESRSGFSGSLQIQSATVEGNVVLVQQPGSKPGAPAQPELRATAQQAVYEGAGERLHLTGSPRVVDGGLELSAERIDVSQATGDAFARGNVKATWIEPTAGHGARPAALTAGQGAMTMGGQGPAHAIAAEAQLHQATGEATFRGQVRLWQLANSISAPVIVLDRAKQTLVARATSPAEPVRVVLLTTANPASGKTGRLAAPSVIRVRGGNLKYSAAERKAVIDGGAAGSVVSESEDGTTVSSELELLLLPPGNHAGKDGAAAQVDRMTARGHVMLTSGDRRGTGEQLVCKNETGECVLTGTSTAPPSISDPVRGSVTGEALIFNSHDDSVSIEGGGQKTRTVTTSPR